MMTAARSTDSTDAPRLRSAGLRTTLAVCALLLIAALLALGTWQVFRLQWKLDLIARVEQRVHASPAPAPGPERWAQVTAASDEYRHVALTGVYLPEFSTKVQASTERGSGYWLLTPLCGTDGTLTLVNRGFVPLDDAGKLAPEARAGVSDPCAAAHAAAASAGAAPVTINGLLRISEAAGAYLRHNDPAQNRWFAREVPAIAAARGLPAAHLAPYFVDADANQEPQGEGVRPIGGMTVISFHNSHLVYALTWYALAAMAIGALVWVIRDDRRARRAA